MQIYIFASLKWFSTYRVNVGASGTWSVWAEYNEGTVFLVIVPDSTFSFPHFSVVLSRKRLNKSFQPHKFLTSTPSKLNFAFRVSTHFVSHYGLSRPTTNQLNMLKRKWPGLSESAMHFYFDSWRDLPDKYSPRDNAVPSAKYTCFCRWTQKHECYI